MATLKKVYLRLADEASSYNDTASGVSLAKNEVVFVESADGHLAEAKFKTLAVAIKGGHVRKASEGEYEESQGFMAGLEEDAKEARKTRKQKEKIKKDAKKDLDAKSKESKVDEDEDEEDEADEEDEDDELTEAEMRDKLKESSLVTKKEDLPKLKGAKLKELYNTIFASKK